MRHHQGRDRGDKVFTPSRCLMILAFVSLVVLLFNVSSYKKTEENLQLRSGDEKEIVLIGQFHKTGPEMSLEKSNPKPVVESSKNSHLPDRKKKIIAYAITVTKDGPFVDGALVLGYSAMKVHDESKGFKSVYDAALVAFVTPKVVTSREILRKFGWIIIERDLPVLIDEIENKDYAEKMRNSGCCGADEFLKLWAYTLTDYHRVVHLDMDSVVFNNMVRLNLSLNASNYLFLTLGSWSFLSG